jgi:hypothetical protein
METLEDDTDRQTGKVPTTKLSWQLVTYLPSIQVSVGLSLGQMRLTNFASRHVLFYRSQGTLVLVCCSSCIFVRKLILLSAEKVVETPPKD